MSKKTPKKNGRPNLYDTRIAPYLDLIARLKAEGKDDKYIYTLLNVSQRTFYTHKSVIDEFSQSYKNGTDDLLDEIENSLYDLALGKATKRTTIIRKDADGQVTSQEERVEQLPPDKIAAFFVLTNRRNDEWKHRNESTVKTSDDTINAIKELTDTINESK